MLTAELVRARVREGRLELVALRGAARERALEYARRYVEITERAAREGATREELQQAWQAVEVDPRDRKLAAGLRKLLEDRCEFDVAADVEPADLRRAVFERASAARAALEADQYFDRDAVLREIAEARDLSVERLERLLYADLRSAHRLLRYDAITAELLLRSHDLGQAQAALLRATRVRVDVASRTPESYRRLFRRLKFHRLLHTIERRPDGTYRIEISGPYDLFTASTKYGLQLALMLPALRELDRWTLDAEVRWGKRRESLRFRLEGDAQGGDGQAAVTTEPDRDGPLLPDDVAKLLERFGARDTPWRARPNEEILSLAGVGEVIPDLVFEHAETGRRVFFEALGFWSRDAVWRRVELAQRGLPEPIVFAVPKRLRVSEKVLDSELPAALYVYKGVIDPKAIEARLDDLA
ncbi:MAG: DUF790 family protein [Polyangiales bacterium]